MSDPRAANFSAIDALIRRSENCTKSKRKSPANQSQTGPSPRPEIPQPVPCRGVSVEWKNLFFLETYPYHLHVSPLVNLDRMPNGFLHDEETVISRATGTEACGVFHTLPISNVGGNIHND